MRQPGTNIYGRNFAQTLRDQVWNRRFGLNTEGFDACRNLIKRFEYGNTKSPYGWEIDHIRPVSMGGRDNIENLRPLQWRTNRTKGDNFPWHC